jgi:HPt (histidine-containing phosphotransfer) domain-containing protein
MSTEGKSYSLESLGKILGNNEEQMKKMVEKFMEVSPDAVSRLNRYFDAKDFEMVSKVAHEMKPSIDLMGIDELKNDIRLLIDYAKDVNKHMAIPTMINKVNTVMNRVFDEVREDFSL